MSSTDWLMRRLWRLHLKLRHGWAWKDSAQWDTWHLWEYHMRAHVVLGGPSHREKTR